MNQCKTLRVDFFPDANFAGLYGHEKASAPVCTKIRTGFGINVANCPVLWVSKLQTETALSTMEAEINSLAHSSKELFPIVNLAYKLSMIVGLSTKCLTTMYVSIHEDNAGALILTEMIPPHFTTCSKSYALKTVWFS